METQAIAKLLTGRLQSEASWREAIDALYAGHPGLIAQAEEHLGEDDLLRLLSVLVIYVGQIGFRTPERKARLFDAAQSMGVHVLPVHYSSPVPDTAELPERLWRGPRDPGAAIDLNVEGQLAFLAPLRRWSAELEDVPLEDAGGGFFWNNSQLYRTDAALYYATIRELRPARVVEIGGGYSTLVAARAAASNGTTELVCVEPFPSGELRDGFPGLGRLIEQPLQDVERSLFSDLRAGDVLFVDGTHVSRIGSDVNHLFFEILPALAPGVVLHFHDVFTPWDYPERWVKERQIFWNEQYLLEAFLSFNREFEVLCLTNYLGERHPEAVRDALGLPARAPAGGSSAWLRRRTG
jgi:hypothetical protein